MRILPAALLALLSACSPGTVEASSPDVRVEPFRGTAGEFGTWTVRVRVPEGGVRPGGHVRVQLPDTWHAGARNSATPLQASEPTADHHVTARASREGVRLACTVEGEQRDRLVKSARPSLDGRSERYVFVVRVEVLEGRLEEGDEVAVVYGDTSGGGRGMRAGEASAGPEAVLVEVDPGDGDGEGRLLRGAKRLVLRGGQATELLLAGPSTLVAGRPAELRLAFVDRLANPAGTWPREAEVEVLAGEAELSSPARFEDAPWTTVTLTPRAAGLVRLRAAAGELRAAGPPMRVHAEEPELATYWGDLHSHTRYSWDGVGDGSFAYARYVSGLDFYAATDHAMVPDREGRPRGLAGHLWDVYTARTERHHDPGRFVTLHAYECSMITPYGHHNVYFAGEPGPLLAPQETSLPELWEALTAGEALTVPHHTGKFPPMDWEAHDGAFRRNVELYSAHGLSEALDPEHPLAFEQSEFTSPGRSIRRPQYAQDAWQRGLVLSTIASSDDHRAHPGQPHYGLTAVRATSLTRAGIFDALHARRTWATTGQRILLDFEVSGTPMGGEVELDGPAELRLEAHGTGPIAWVEVLRWRPGEEAFTVLERLEPGTPDVVWEGRHEEVGERAIYYARLRQEGEVRGRAVMAWSSPVWASRRR